MDSRIGSGFVVQEVRRMGILGILLVDGVGVGRHVYYVHAASEDRVYPVLMNLSVTVQRSRELAHNQKGIK
jgi:hypothetical protein